MTNRSKSVGVVGPLAACVGPSVPGVVHTGDRSPHEGNPQGVAIAFRAFFARYRDSPHGAQGADPQQVCKNAVVDDWTATMSAVDAGNPVACE